MNDTRRHTSTVTVAVLAGEEQDDETFDLADVDIESYRGSGPGGQHRNKTETGVRVRHRPTGLEAKADRGRSWWQNRNEALAELERRVTEHLGAVASTAENSERISQIGAGDRFSHDWTWCAWRDEVTCHRTGKRWNMSRALRGRFLGRK